MTNNRFWSLLVAVVIIVCAVATPFSAAVNGEHDPAVRVDTNIGIEQDDYQIGSGDSDDQDKDDGTASNQEPDEDEPDGNSGVNTGGKSDDPAGDDSQDGAGDDADDDDKDKEDETSKDGEDRDNKRDATSNPPNTPVVNEDGYTVYAADAGIGEQADSDYTHYSGVWIVENDNGPVLSYHEDSDINILYKEIDGGDYYFKDLNHNGKLDTYEDWRLSTQERAEDLAYNQLNLDDKLGLMIHGSVTSQADIDVGARFSLNNEVDAADVMAEFNNQIQRMAESSEFGLPLVTSTDPRHTGTVDSGNPTTTEEGGLVSLWPETFGLSAAFDPEIFSIYGDIVAEEYRALGIHLMLGPQLDLVTDPRWVRANGSITEDPQLNIDLTNAFIEALQSDNTDTDYGDYGIDEGWGYGSVATMAKHWPSGGSGEFGLDAHFELGKLNVYPGDYFDELVEMMAEAMGLDEDDGSVRKTASVMPYYSVSFNQDVMNGLNVGNGFSEYIIQHRLRDDYSYEGMVCTDWGIVQESPGMPWGLEGGKGYTQEYRIVITWLAGVDQFGGMFTMEFPVLKSAYLKAVNGGFTEFGLDAISQEDMDQIIDTSIVRIARVMLNLGLLEHPYIDPEESQAVVSSEDKMLAAYEQGHQKSVVMLKNTDGALPLDNTDGRPTAYVPIADLEYDNIISKSTQREPVIDYELVENCFDVPDVLKSLERTPSALNPYSWTLPTEAQKRQALAESDVVIIKLDSPHVVGGNIWQIIGLPGLGHVDPNNLAYSPYTADWMREVSIGYDWVDENGGYLHFSDIPEDGRETEEKYRSNRSYHGQSHAGEPDRVALIQDTVRLVKDMEHPIPIVFVIDIENPMVVSDFEPYADAILMGSNVSDVAFLQAIAGQCEPSGLLQANMPISMDTVDLSYEDAPHDMVPYKDSEGNRYTFGFGLDYNGQIVDDRVERYARNTASIIVPEVRNIVVYPGEKDWYPTVEDRHLTALVSQAKELNPRDYSHVSYTMVAFASSFAENILSYNSPTQAQVNAAAYLLRDAIRDLQPADSGEAGADKNALATMIDMTEEMIQALNQSDYTPESWTAVTAALEQAIKVNGDSNATQQDVTDAIKALTDAVEGLTLRNPGGSNNNNGGGSSRGGGNGGSSGWSNPGNPFGVIAGAGATVAVTSANVNADGSVNQTTITTEAKTALDTTPQGGTATVRTQNAKTISAATLNALSEAARAVDKSIMFTADTMSGSAVQGRLYVEPGKISGDLQLGVYTEAGQVAALKALLEKWFSNKFAVVKFEQQGGFGARLRVAVKADLSDIDAANLRFYSYDQNTNSYRTITNPAYFVDANGYLHFYTQQAGSVIISEGELIRK